MARYRVACLAMLLQVSIASGSARALALHLLRVLDAPGAHCLGTAASAVGDLNGDSIPDILVGAPGQCGVVATSAEAILFSGSNAAILHVLRFGAVSNGLGTAAAGMGDVNGDFVSDYALGAPTELSGETVAGAVYVVSGATNQVLYSISGEPGDRLGFSLARITDRDKDGVSELLVGAPSHVNSSGVSVGEAVVYSGATGAPLFRFEGPTSGDLLGASVAEITDLTGDGVPELLAGAPSENGGSAYILAGVDASLIRRITAPFNVFGFGQCIASSPDLDGDGFDDLLVGAPESSVRGPDEGAVLAYSSRTALGLGVQSGPRLSRLGASLIDASQLRGDSTPVQAAGAPGRALADGAFELVTVAKDSLIQEVPGPPQGALGTSLCTLPDLNGDGRNDLLVGAPTAKQDLASSGQAYVYGYVEIAPGEARVQGDTTLVAPGDLKVAVTGGVVSPGDFIQESLVLRVSPPPIIDIPAVRLITSDQGAVIVFAKSLVRAAILARPTSELSMEGDLRSGERFVAPVASSLSLGAAENLLIAPSPMRSNGTLSFRTARAGRVRLDVFSVQGRLLRVLFDGWVAENTYRDVQFDGRDRHGSTLPSGVYILRLQSGHHATTSKLVRVR